MIARTCHAVSIVFMHSGKEYWTEIWLLLVFFCKAERRQERELNWRLDEGKFSSTRNSSGQSKDPWSQYFALGSGQIKFWRKKNQSSILRLLPFHSSSHPLYCLRDIRSGGPVTFSWRGKRRVSSLSWWLSAVTLAYLSLNLYRLKLYPCQNHNRKLLVLIICFFSFLACTFLNWVLPPRFRIYMAR